jgi:hypothetical protein
VEWPKPIVNRYSLIVIRQSKKRPPSFLKGQQRTGMNAQAFSIHRQHTQHIVAVASIVFEENAFVSMWAKITLRANEIPSQENNSY